MGKILNSAGGTIAARQPSRKVAGKQPGHFWKRRKFDGQFQRRGANGDHFLAEQRKLSGDRLRFGAEIGLIAPSSFKLKTKVTAAGPDAKVRG